MNPTFRVSAECFYALTAHMPPQVDVERRFRLCCLDDQQRTARALRDAIASGVVTANAADVIAGNPPLTPDQAARRLRALGTGLLPNPEQELQVQVPSPIADLVTAWLGFPGPDIAAFWLGAMPAHAAAHLDLTLIVMTRDHDPLITAIKAVPGVNDIEDVVALQIVAPAGPSWRTLFFPAQAPERLPPFTLPGSREERFNAFMRHVRNFFRLTSAGVQAPQPTAAGDVPQLERSIEDPLEGFVNAYMARGGPAPVFGNLNQSIAEAAAADVFPTDPAALAWLEQAVRAIDALYRLANIGVSDDLRFSIAEALYARGFTSEADVAALSLADFRSALTGTVAYDHANAIYGGLVGPTPTPGGGGFRPINPDGLLTNCVPLPHRSPLGPVAYLQEMLKVTEASTCEEPEGPLTSPENLEDTLDELIAQRRGPLSNLHVTAANLSTPLPRIDLVNECLEALAAGLPNPSPHGVVYDTAGDQLGGHAPQPVGPSAPPPPAGNPPRFLHDPATLFEVLPEHSTPATPVALPAAYDALRSDVSAPTLPYSQPLDVNRSYLCHLKTSRFEVMRTFRRDITELVLDPAAEPAEFQRHLWRYPVRIDTAREYLKISPEEYDLVFARDLNLRRAADQSFLQQLYGFESDIFDGRPWTAIVVVVSEFLKRTGLSYCELLELWRSEFVRFRPVGLEAGFPDCQPCYLDTLVIQISEPLSTSQGLKRLAVFIRLWRKLQQIRGAQYSFAQLRDICNVLHLFNNGSLNPDFIRQLVAFQMLRDHFALTLSDPDDTLPGVDADRTHLLALWASPPARKWDWAVDSLLDGIQHYSQQRHRCGERPRELIKLLVRNLDALSGLAGFDPGSATDNWHARPTHTLRFAEILAKIYASRFGVVETIFLFTAEPHRGGYDPFPLQPDNEAVESPLGLPDDEEGYSLRELREKLCKAKPTEEEVCGWTWTNIDATLREKFGYKVVVGEPDRLLSLGEHFFPDILEECGCKVDPLKRQYRVPLLLADTVPLMWNTPPEGPFRYDSVAEQLWTQLPLTDEAVITKLGRIRQLEPAERTAVQNLYFLPRVDLAAFAFLFENFGDAEKRLTQEPDQSRRWAYFRQQFALCYARCNIIAEHLASHVTKITGQCTDEGHGLAWTLLKNLFADENRATTPPPPTWEADDGTLPSVTWAPPPSGGGFAALLGLTGIGLLGEFMPEDEANPLTFVDDSLQWPDNHRIWREVRGPTDAFGPEENASNAPIPTVLPTMDLVVSDERQRFADIRNGFALSNQTGDPLGGAQGFAARWRGMLLIEKEGRYVFHAGAHTPEGEEPCFETARHRRWRVMLKRGQWERVLLSHQWPDTHEPAASSAPQLLRCGTYELTIEFIQPQPSFSRPEEVCRQATGFQLKYVGPDSCDRLIAIPINKLFRDFKDDTLEAGLVVPSVGEQARTFLRIHYTSTLRDIRRTYQRAFKALLFCHLFDLSAKPIADDGQSEIGFMLSHADDFAGRSYFRDGGGFAVHLAFFDFNFLPILDNYIAPVPAQDQRAQPAVRRQQALFDWWERLFDYTILRREASRARERPVWLMFHEAAERHPDDPAHLVRHMGIDIAHSERRALAPGANVAGLVLLYYRNYEVSSADLEDERWAVRVWRAELWIRSLLVHFACREIQAARPDLWASDDPRLAEVGETETGNANLTKFVRDGGFENGEPRRYLDVKKLNDDLRERGREALLTFLCRMSRVPLPWGGFAAAPKDLTDLLLLDVEAGLCQRASRIEDATSAVQTFVQRARLGLEPGFVVSPAFVLLWDRRFATFHIWEACKRREIYRENWIDWDELRQARRGEAFRFLEAELRRAALTVPVPGGLEYWPDRLPPDHPGLMVLQSREPARIEQLRVPKEGLGLLGTPERHARPSWLAAQSGGKEVLESPESPESPDREALAPEGTGLPFWIEAAIRLGTRFLRVAAAGLPPASTSFEPHHPDDGRGCCVECGKPHPAVVDEYYFWLIDSRHYTEGIQDSDWGSGPLMPGQDEPDSDWHKPDRLPSLLHWPSEPMVHLAWCRVHNGEFQPPRRSDEGVRLASGVTPNSATPQLVFLGRHADSLNFEVSDGESPPGFPAAPNPGFRYDIATDTAVVLPEVVAPTQPLTVLDGLPAYPFFAYFLPGAPLMPTSLFSPAVAVAGWLRAHCRFEAALKWYELVRNPLAEDSIWCERAGDGRRHAACCSSIVADPQARDRSITLHYLETLLQWGDAVMRRNSPEAFQQARLIFDTATGVLGSQPRTIVDVDSGPNPPTIAAFVPSRAPLNPRLLLLYERVYDRLALIHACLNARRLRNGRANKDVLYWGNSPTRDGWLTTVEVCPEEEDWCYPHSCYRFNFLVRMAQDLAGEVRALGAALLAAYDRGDAEYLASLRSAHERQLLNLALEVRQNQWREADWQRQALQKTKEIARANRKYYQTLIDNGLNGGENHYEEETHLSLSFQLTNQIMDGIAEGVSWIPDINLGTVGPCPTVINQLPLGTKLGGIFATAARISGSLANSASTRGSLSLTQAGWVRREEEWRHQVEALDIEIEQIERQILAAERRRDVALRELNNHRRQMEHAGEVQDFLRDKFTSHALYLWLQQETAALHRQMYELSLHTARQAQHAFNYERGHVARKFLPADMWDSLHEGLQAGERLQLALRQMEKAYLDDNCREYELTKHFSLRLQFPMQFLLLKVTGRCEIEVPEWMFDLDYPGHYLRRIRNVTLTLPCVVGPYTGVHCRLTLLGSTTRVDPRLRGPSVACCTDNEPGDGYEALPDDPRIVRQYAAKEAIATSSGQNDSGLFELSFRDERYLPFEFAGAVGRWRIELPPENNFFDLDTLSDVVMHVNYTAREGGDVLKDPANCAAQRHLPGDGWRFFDIEHDFPDQWPLISSVGEYPRELHLRLGRNMFPFLPSGGEIRVDRLELLFETEAEKSASHAVAFTVARKDMHKYKDNPDCKPQNISCMSSKEWPTLYHGVWPPQDQDPKKRERLSPQGKGGQQDLGSFCFPSEIGCISRAYLFCHYEVA